MDPARCSARDVLPPPALQIDVTPTPPTPEVIPVDADGHTWLSNG
jgi:hypothetical protein